MHNDCTADGYGVLQQDAFLLTLKLVPRQAFNSTAEKNEGGRSDTPACIASDFGYENMK